MTILHQHPLRIALRFLVLLVCRQRGECLKQMAHQLHDVLLVVHGSRFGDPPLQLRLQCPALLATDWC